MHGVEVGRYDESNKLILFSEGRKRTDLRNGVGQAD
jgi:hypothetical protein